MFFELASPFFSAERALFPLVAAIGTGCLFQIPLIALQAAMPLKDLATSTASFIFVRQLGGTIGVSIGQAIWSSVRSTFITHCPTYFFYTLLTLLPLPLSP